MSTSLRKSLTPHMAEYKQNLGQIFEKNLVVEEVIMEHLRRLKFKE